MKQILKGWFLWVWYYLYKPYRKKRKEEACARIELCESCEYFNQIFRSCKHCGCQMDVKTKMRFDLDENDKAIDENSINACSEKKW